MQDFHSLFKSGIYTESIQSKQKPYSTVENYAIIIFDIKIIHKMKLNGEVIVFIDNQVIF